MRSSRLANVFVFIASVAVAATIGCGGDDGGGGGGGTPDAKVFMDAPAQMDAPASLSGLGQKCDPAMQGADCPSNAAGCLTFAQGATSGICTTLCLQSGTFSTDAQSQPGPFTPDPTTMNSVCAGIYTGSVGAGVCEALVNVMPAPPLKPNTDYTFQAACAVQCGAGNACPTGLTCDTQTMWCKP